MGILVEDWVSRAMVECGILLQHREDMFLHTLLLTVPCLETSRTVIEGLGSCLLPCGPCGLTQLFLLADMLELQLDFLAL